MNDGKIHIPARKKPLVSEQQVVRLSPEAYNFLIELYNESPLSMKELASMLILAAEGRIVFDKGES